MGLGEDEDMESLMSKEAMMADNIEKLNQTVGIALKTALSLVPTLLLRVELAVSTVDRMMTLTMQRNLHFN